MPMMASEERLPVMDSSSQRVSRQGTLRNRGRTGSGLGASALGPLSGSSSYVTLSDSVTPSNEMHFKLEGNTVRDVDGAEVGRMARPPFMSRAWWSNVARCFQAVQDSALFHYAKPLELHVAISAIGELFVIAGSLIAGFSLQFFEIADLSQLAFKWYLPNSVFITLAFLSGIACVVVAAMLFIGISTVPVSHVHVFANHMSWWLLRPGILMGLSFVFMGAAFTTISLRAPYPVAAWSCLGIIVFILVLLVCISLELMQRIVCVRDFVKIDTQREIARKKREMQERKDLLKQRRRSGASTKFARKISRAKLARSFSDTNLAQRSTVSDVEATSEGHTKML
ncbi:hypothetical protein FVE85_2048 [Porphyridium purpureum]|uniref:Transmembrane protein n=1 Tax=Porphyridium purpureum TaxID=35688 RepID=A0A5J4YZ36_PORPP|nr:hypothetical protein FVE85_2048 [Porphyridium purpureum]|eukprot:POR9220..scf209_3